MRLMIRTTTATTSSRWIKLPPTWPMKPRSQRMTRMTIIVQSMSIPFGSVKLSSAYLFRDSSPRQAFSKIESKRSSRFRKIRAPQSTTAINPCSPNWSAVTNCARQSKATPAQVMHMCRPVKSSRYFRRCVRFPNSAIQTATGARNIYMSADKGYFNIICAVCERLIQQGKGPYWERIVSVCDDCRKQSYFEAKRHQARALRKNQQERGASS
jgi:hypothetical protein